VPDYQFDFLQPIEANALLLLKSPADNLEVINAGAFKALQIMPRPKQELSVNVPNGILSAVWFIAYNFEATIFFRKRTKPHF